jgi:peptidoglycan/xylan/chitin deacetylase (PgdA/CDA1 family)
VKIRFRKPFIVTLITFVIFAFGGWQLSRSRSYQVFGDIVPRVETAEKVVALTFDDGPWKVGVDFVLPVLRARDVKATFFLMGSALEQESSLGARIVADGHEIGNHSYSHQRMVLKGQSFIAEEIERTDRLIRSIGYTGPIHFRPPYGKKLLGLPWYLSRHDRKTITWDVAPESYKEIAASSDRILEYVQDKVRPGSIILLHPMAMARTESREAVPKIIDALLAAGYRFVTVSELLSLRAPEAG